MRFWQAVVTAQLASGSVWADRFEDLPSHMAAEVASIAIGATLWLLFKPRAK